MIFKIIFLNRLASVQRCSRPLCSSQSTGGTLSAAGAAGVRKGPEVGCAFAHPVPQDPTACMCRLSCLELSRPEGRTDSRIDPRHLVKCSTHELPAETFALIRVLEDRSLQMLLRKEVIQPHLPVRLPCYDLVLITDPTFDGSLHKGWATGFRCYRLS